MNIKILSTSSFPWGMAATTRIRCLGKAMIDEGANVEYIGLCGADVSRSPYKAAQGQVENILYTYPGGFSVRPETWLMRRVDDFSSTISILLKFLKAKISNKIDIVLIYSRDPKATIFWTKASHLLNIPVILELCEWPLAIAETTNSGTDTARKFCNVAVPEADGIIPISSYIEHEATKIAETQEKALPSFKIPILMDTDKCLFDGNLARDGKEGYILYSGSISYFDIACLVVDISDNLSRMGLDTKIKFTGSGNTALFAKLKRYAQTRKVLDNFEFTGFVDDEKLFKLMRGATALLAPMPENTQSISRFPTKIGYYLSSGRPVITNAIGDIPLYLEDGVNAYVASSCSPILLAEKINEVFSDSERANRTGSAGMITAFEHFHYKQACTGIVKFIFSIIKRRNDCA